MINKPVITDEEIINWERQYNKRMLKAYLKGHEYFVHGKTKEGYPNYFKVLNYKQINN